MAKVALLVGIDDYDQRNPLAAAVADATAMRDMLETDSGGRNFHCRLLTYPGGNRVTTEVLNREAYEIFQRDPADTVLFYFAGHGSPSDVGGYLCSVDSTKGSPGLQMSNLLLFANGSTAKEVFLILDCCYAGDLGNPPNLQGAQLREGVTILASSTATQVSREENGRGIFTGLLLDALAGGAADVRGFVSAASIYAYAEQGLGPFEQRPLFKSYARTLSPLRRARPELPDELLAELPILFTTPDSEYRLTPAHEQTDPTADPALVSQFKQLQKFRDAHLVKTKSGKDFFFACYEKEAVILKPLGRLYWRLVSKKVIIRPV